MEHREGEQVWGYELDLDALGRVARDAGRYIGEIHDLGSFDRYGVLHCRQDDPGVEAGVVVDGCTIGVGDGDDSWREWLVDQIDQLAEEVVDRFGDLLPAVTGYLESNAHLLAGDGPPVLTHADYFYKNLLVDRGTGETRAVLDHGKMLATPAEYTLAQTEQFLCEFDALDSERRRRVREQLHAGYGETNAVDRDAAFERRREYYLATTWLGPLALFDVYAEKYEADADEQADRYRRALTTLTSRPRPFRRRRDASRPATRPVRGGTLARSGAGSARPEAHGPGCRPAMAETVGNYADRNCK